MSPPGPIVGVVGASARAAVHSLARAGVSAWAIDLFGDRDLLRTAQTAVCSMSGYPDTLPGLATRFPPGPVLYTGGLENHPGIVAELAATRGLWGNPPDVLAIVRDPYQLSRLLATTDAPGPSVCPRGEHCPTTGTWIRKPIQSSAGRGIRLAVPDEAASDPHYFQQFVAGTPHSAVYSDSRLFGVTEQLVGENWLHAGAFSYAGSIGPIRLSAEMMRRLIHLGSTVSDRYGLRGPWNTDFVLTTDSLFPVELNPRYSASVEVLEHATGRGVWGGVSPPGDLIGKAIYFAPYDLRFPDEGPWTSELFGVFEPWRLPNYADIPEAGTPISQGQPVLTYFVRGSSTRECRERLQSRAAELDNLFTRALT